MNVAKRDIGKIFDTGELTDDFDDRFMLADLLFAKQTPGQRYL